MGKETLLVMESDGDSPIVSTLYIEYVGSEELTICLETEQYCKPIWISGRMRKTKAVLDKDCIGILSSRLRVPPEKLAERLCEKFHEDGFVSRNWFVRNHFKDMLELILDKGGKYRLVEGW